MTIDKPTIKLLIEMPLEQRKELDVIATEIGIPRNALIRIACREYATRFFSAKRLTDKPIDILTSEPFAA